MEQITFNCLAATQNTLRSSTTPNRWQNREIPDRENGLPFTAQFFPVQLIHGIVGVSVVIKFLTRTGERYFP